MIAQSGREAVLKQEGEATLKRALISGVALPTPAKAGCKEEPAKARLISAARGRLSLHSGLTMLFNDMAPLRGLPHTTSSTGGSDLHRAFLAATVREEGNRGSLLWYSPGESIRVCANTLEGVSFHRRECK